MIITKIKQYTLLRKLAMLFKKIPFLICFVFLVSFNMENNLKSDKILIETFNNEELNDINFLIDYADKLVKKETKNDDINKAYHIYFDQLKKSIFENNYIIPFNSETKSMLLDSIKESTFNEFWQVYSSKNETNRCNIASKKLSININGKYVDYIRKLGETDTLFYDLHNNIMRTGDISRTGIIKLFAENNSLDFKIIKNRLLAVVCIFSISEPIEKTED